MRKVILLLIMMCLPMIGMAQSYTRSGDTFVATSTSRTKSEPTKTKFTYKDSDNKNYPIYIGKTGSCFIVKTSSKTGKEYRKYLGEEISKQICKEMNVQYNGKRRN